MADNSKIEWTDATFNPWWGCTKVSPGCDNCYAEAWAKRTGHGGTWGPRPQYRTFSDKHWNEPLRWDRKAREAGVRKRVFCASMADVFDNHAPENERERLWDLMRHTTNLTWLLLTKRVRNIDKLLPDDLKKKPSVWPGISVVNQEEADRDIPVYISNRGVGKLWVSAEPLLEPIMFNRFRELDLIIVGGESGSKTRYMHPWWAQIIRNQCRKMGTAFFMKQMTRKEPIPDDLMVREWP